MSNSNSSFQKRTRNSRPRSRTLVFEPLEDRRMLAFGDVFGTQIIDDEEVGHGEFLEGPATTVRLNDGRGGSRNAIVLANDFELLVMMMASDGHIEYKHTISQSTGWQQNLVAPSWFLYDRIANVGDLNGDGNEDLAVASTAFLPDDEETSEFHVLFLDDDGSVKAHNSFGPETVLSAEQLVAEATTANFGRGLAAFDSDGNGRAELYIPWHNPLSKEQMGFRVNLDADGSVKSVREYSAAEFAIPEPFRFDKLYGGFIEIGDIDNDSTPDLAAFASLAENNGAWAYGALFVFLMNPNGEIRETKQIGFGEGGVARSFQRTIDVDNVAFETADLNGDGRLELFVSEPDRTMSVMFLNNEATVLSTQIVGTNQGGFSGEWTAFMGNWITSIPDLDADGVPDLLVGDGLNNGLHLLHMDSDGSVSSQEFITAEHEKGLKGDINDNDLFGSSIVDIGDLDGNGVSDLLVGAPRGAGLDDQLLGGRVQVLLMEEDGTVAYSRAISRLQGFSGADIPSIAEFGASVAFLGDRNQNQLPEVAVGAPGSGAIYILELDATESNNVGFPIVKANEIQYFDEATSGIEGLGWSVESIGDVNNDGFDDIAVGAPYAVEGDSAGVVWILFLDQSGDILDSHKISNLSAASPRDGVQLRFGTAIAGLGDINGDGVPDIAVADHLDQVFDVLGTINLLFLNRDGSVSESHRINADSEEDFPFRGIIGRDIANFGDIDGNGVNDLLVTWSRLDESHSLPFVLLLDDQGDVLNFQALPDESARTGNEANVAVSTWGERQPDGTLYFVTGESQYQGHGFDRGMIAVSGLNLQFDRGDAPDGGDGTSPGNYQTFAFDNGPSHFIDDEIRLGALIDGEDDAFSSVDAAGDDENPTIAENDEDGVVNPSESLSLRVGQTPAIEVKATSEHRDATLAGWIDYNGNGEFELSERATVKVFEGIGEQTVTLHFPVVPSYAVADTFARFRLSTDLNALSPTGFAYDGEVEDYAVSIDTLQSNLTPVLLKDITENGGSDIDVRNIITVSGKTFFLVDDTQLWVSEGREDDAIKVADVTGFINPVAYGDSVYFWNYLGNDGIWKSDGTVAGTGPVLGQFTNNPNTFPVTKNHTLSSGIEWNGKLYFSHFRHSHAGNWGSNWLFESDGTPAGTSRVEATFNGHPYPYSTATVGVLNNQLMFLGTGGAPGGPNDGLYAYDGANEPTLIKDLAPSRRTTTEFIAAGDRLYFLATDATGQGIELWTTDGSNQGTQRIADLSSRSRLVAVKNHVYWFEGAPAQIGFELFRAAGDNVEKLLDVDGQFHGEFHELAAAGQNVFFAAPVDSPTHEVSDLWKLDTLTLQASLVRDLANIPTRSDPNPTYLTPVGDILYYRGFTFDERYEIWRSDGTSDGTYLVRDLNPTGHGVGFPPSPQYSPLHAAGEQLFFVGSNGNDGANGFEPWALVPAKPPHLTIADAVVTETDAGSTIAEFVVTLSDASSPFTVSYTTADGTATTVDSDYQSAQGQLSFAGTAGETQTIQVPIIGDMTVELDEHFIVNLSNVSLESVFVADPSAFGHIRNNDQASFTISEPQAHEDIGQLFFEVTLDNAVDTSLTVDYWTRNGTAKVRQDYVYRSGRLSFQGYAGESATILVQTKPDSLVELDETVLLVLSNVRSSSRDVTTGNSPAAGMIVNDEQAKIWIYDQSNLELDAGWRTYRFGVVLNHRVDHPVSLVRRVNLVTADANDFYGNRYTTPKTEQFYFHRGRTVSARNIYIRVKGDVEVESTEVFQVLLSDISAGGRDVIFDDSSAVGKIVNDDGVSEFGDAPAPYPVLLADDGARHLPGGPGLGAERDLEADGSPSNDAGGDDDDLDVDDEDGVIFTTSLVAESDAATTSSVRVQATRAGKLDAWIDFNADGDWQDADEQIFVGTSLAAGVNDLSFQLPAGAQAGLTAARFRISTAGGLPPTGLAQDGEVEDYLVSILSAPADVSVLSHGGRTEVHETNGDIQIVRGEFDLFRASEPAVASLVVTGGDQDEVLQLNTEALIASFHGGAGIDELVIGGADRDWAIDPNNVDRFSSVEVIDIRGSGSNSLSIHSEQVAAITDEVNQLRVVHDDDDQAQIGGNWRLATVQATNDAVRHTFSSDGLTLQVDNTAAWQNPTNRFDVDGDGFVTARDVFVPVQDFIEFGARELTGDSPTMYLDVSGKEDDGQHHLSLVDPFQVVEELSRLRQQSGPQSAPAGEGERPDDSRPESALVTRPEPVLSSVESSQLTQRRLSKSIAKDRVSPVAPTLQHRLRDDDLPDRFVTPSQADAFFAEPLDDLLSWVAWDDELLP